MINATDTAFQKTPEPVDSIGVNISFDIDLGAVIDDMMLVSVAPNSPVASHVVGIDRRFRGDGFSEHRHQSLGFDIDNFLGNDSSLSFHDSRNRSFSFCPVSELLPPIIPQ